MKVASCLLLSLLLFAMYTEFAAASSFTDVVRKAMRKSYFENNNNNKIALSSSSSLTLMNNAAATPTPGTCEQHSISPTEGVCAEETPLPIKLCSNSPALSSALSSFLLSLFNGMSRISLLVEFGSSCRTYGGHINPLVSNSTLCGMIRLAIDEIVGCETVGGSCVLDLDSGGGGGGGDGEEDGNTKAMCCPFCECASNVLCEDMEDELKCSDCSSKADCIGSSANACSFVGNAATTTTTAVLSTTAAGGNNNNNNGTNTDGEKSNGEGDDDDKDTSLSSSFSENWEKAFPRLAVILTLVAAAVILATVGAIVFVSRQRRGGAMQFQSMK